MRNSVRLWEKESNYYLTGFPQCPECDKHIEDFAIIQWLDNKMLAFHIDCNKKEKYFFKHKCLLLSEVVEERPHGSSLIDRPFQSLVNSDQVNNDILENNVEIINKTKFAGKESLQGASIGVIDGERIKQLDSSVNDIDSFLLEIKKSKIKRVKGGKE